MREVFRHARAGQRAGLRRLQPKPKCIIIAANLIYLNFTVSFDKCNACHEKLSHYLNLKHSQDAVRMHRA